MEPQEIFEYKRKWLHTTTFTAYVNMDLWHTCNDFCKEHFEKHRWASRRFARPDDAHWFAFERREDLNKFASAFDTLEDWSSCHPPYLP